MAGIVGQKISEMRGQRSGQLTINTIQIGLRLWTPVVVTIDGTHAKGMIKSGGINNIVPLTDDGCFDTPLRFREWALYKTKAPNKWYQIHTSMTPGPALKAIGIDSEARGIKTKDEAYAHVLALVDKYEVCELEMVFWTICMLDCELIFCFLFSESGSEFLNGLAGKRSPTQH